MKHVNGVFKIESVLCACLILMSAVFYVFSFFILVIFILAVQFPVVSICKYHAYRYMYLYL